MDAQTAFFRQHGEAVYRFCVYLMRNKTDGEDLYQETCLRALEVLHKIDRQKNPRAYLLAIAVNLRRNLVQKAARRNRIAPMADAGPEGMEGLASAEAGVEAVFERRTENAALVDAVNRLADKHRLPILLHYAQGLKIAEIARILHRPEGSVKRLLHEAKQTIKTEMEGLGYGRTST